MEDKRPQTALEEWQKLQPISEFDRERLNRRFTSTQTYLQEEVGINRSALQKMLATLQNKGYIVKDDKGSWRVFITPSIKR